MEEKKKSFVDRILEKLHLIKYKEQVLYMAVGVGTTLVDWGLFAVFVLFIPSVGGEFLQKITPNFLAYSVAWLSSVIFAYVMSRIFVFEKTGERILTQFLKFLGSRAMTLVFSILGDMLFSKIIGTGKLETFIAKLIISIIVVIINYITSKLLVFKKKKEPKEAEKTDE